MLVYYEETAYVEFKFICAMSRALWFVRRQWLLKVPSVVVLN